MKSSGRYDRLSATQKTDHASNALQRALESIAVSDIGIVLLVINAAIVFIDKFMNLTQAQKRDDFALVAHTVLTGVGLVAMLVGAVHRLFIPVHATDLNRLFSCLSILLGGMVVILSFFVDQFHADLFHAIRATGKVLFP